MARSIVGKGRSSITIPFADPRALHRIDDPEIGDTLLVVTALGPARGFLKPQEFVELRALASAHGIVLQPYADDVTAELGSDKVVITRPGGLSLSSASVSRDNSGSVTFAPMMFDTQTWGFDRQAKFTEREGELVARAAAAPEAKRRAARLDLARFYLARDMAAEAKGVLDVVTADEREGEGVTGTILKSIANVMLGRADEALKELSAPQIGNNNDAPIWRAMAYAHQGRFAEAREGFRSSEVAIGALPIELQRVAKREALRCSIEVRDFAGASTILHDFETLGVPPELAPSLALLTGRLEEGLGHHADALSAYRRAAASKDRRASAQGQLRDLVLRSKLGDLKDKDLVDQLEMLTTTWRGDETEAEGLKVLAHHYTRDKRYRDAFHVMRTALLAHPNSDLTRKIQDEAATTFDSLFLTAEADALPAIEALGLFYDYRALTPIGRRGDEMIRRLADRLVAVDLLDQAAELLQHQVDHRLQGAARAQVATRLATIYLMNRKPDRALAALQRSRSSDLASDLREQRLLLEARALSDIGRHELALEIISGRKSREAMRLRADILWAGKSGARPLSTSKCCMATAGAIPIRSPGRSGWTCCAARSVTRSPKSKWGSRASATNMRARWRTVPISGRSRSSPRRSARARANSAPSPARSRIPARWRRSSPSCASAIPIAASFPTIRRKDRTPCRPAAIAPHPPFHRRRREALPALAPIRRPPARSAARPRRRGASYPLP